MSKPFESSDLASVGMSPESAERAAHNTPTPPNRPPGRQRPGDEAWQTGYEKGGSEQCTAGRRGEGVLVRVTYSCALSGAPLFWMAVLPTLVTMPQSPCHCLRGPHAPGDLRHPLDAPAAPSGLAPSGPGEPLSRRRGLSRTTVPSARRSRGHLP